MKIYNDKEYEILFRELKNKYESSSLKIYDFFKTDQIELIRKYYREYTKLAFKAQMGTLTLNVSVDKVKKLSELKGKGVWCFDGLYDSGSRGNDKCELGHPLRYVYYARNVENNELLKFGIRCVSDFFDVDKKSLNIFNKLKEEMLNELFELVLIIDNNLLDSHYLNVCKELWFMFKNLGFEKCSTYLKDIPSLLCLQFFKLNLPLPKSLYSKLDKNNYIELLSNPVFIGLEVDKIEKLKKSNISLISDMFTYSEDFILSNLCDANSTKSDFYNFVTVEDINTSSFIWEKREIRLLNAQDYFRNRGITKDWFSLYELLKTKSEYRKIPKYYYGLEMLLLFDKNIILNKSFYFPKVYNYKNRVLNTKSLEDFDNILEYLSTKDFFDMLSVLNSELEIETKKEEVEKDILARKLIFLRDNILDMKYNNVKGIDGVRNIIVNKKLDFDNMTSKQKSYVLTICDILENMGKEKVINTTSEDVEVNKRFSLTEKPDILAKIQRLQNENNIIIPEKISQIISTVMSTKWLSMRQIDCIENAYKIYILKEIPETTKYNNKLGKNTLTNKKWNLIERLDIKEKILQIQRHPEYGNMTTENIKSILSNILKYNSVSEKQIESVERTYNKFFQK